MHSRQKGQEQMGKLAEIKDMEQADSNQSKEFEKFAESQKEHNRVMEKLMKMTAGCAVGALAVVVVAVLANVPLPFWAAQGRSALSWSRCSRRQSRHWRMRSKSPSR